MKRYLVFGLVTLFFLNVHVLQAQFSGIYGNVRFLYLNQINNDENYKRQGLGANIIVGVSMYNNWNFGLEYQVAFSEGNGFFGLGLSKLSSYFVNAKYDFKQRGELIPYTSLSLGVVTLQRSNSGDAVRNFRPVDKGYLGGKAEAGLRFRNVNLGYAFNLGGKDVEYYPYDESFVSYHTLLFGYIYDF